MIVAVSTLDEDQFRLLALMDGLHTLAIGISFPLSAGEQAALKRMMLRDWIRLIDIASVESDTTGRLYRIFKVMPEAIRWYSLTKASMN